MNNFQIARAMLKQPQILLPRQHLFLLSHMRANTSVLGHILGSHTNISGYYELHIGYYSWRSLLRQKCIYFEDHEFKDSKYMFDKILHNDHEITENILRNARCKYIFALRKPEDTIKSTVRLYRARRDISGLEDPENAANYYFERTEKLRRLAEMIGQKYFYLDAEAVIKKPKELLCALTRWLELNEPLKKEYKIFKNSGKSKYGDSSDILLKGRIMEGSRDYSDTVISKKTRDWLNQQYENIRETLIRKAETAVMC